MYTTEDLIKELAAGRSTNDILDSFKANLEKAKTAYDKETRETQKRKDFENILNAYQEYYNKYYPDIDIKFEKATRDMLFKEIESICNSVKTYTTPAKGPGRTSLSKFLADNGLV